MIYAYPFFFENNNSIRTICLMTPPNSRLRRLIDRFGSKTGFLLDCPDVPSHLQCLALTLASWSSSAALQLRETYISSLGFFFAGNWAFRGIVKCDQLRITSLTL